MLVSFCTVLAAMYSFFFFSTRQSQDPFGLAMVTLAVLGMFVVLWRRISTRAGFALAVVAVMALVSGVAFGLWLVLYALTGWNTWAAIGGTTLLGLTGIFIGLPSLNVIARQQEQKDA